MNVEELIWVVFSVGRLAPSTPKSVAAYNVSQQCIKLYLVTNGSKLTWIQVTKAGINTHDILDDRGNGGHVGV